MKRFAKFLSALAVMAFLAFGASREAQAAHCISYAGSFCLIYAPDAPAGMTMVAPSYTPAQGEWVGCDGSGAYCIKAVLGAGGFWNVASLGDFATSGGSFGNWPVKSVKSKLCRSTTLYTGFNWTGSTYGYGGGAGSCTNLYSATLPGGSSPCSVSLQN